GGLRSRGQRRCLARGTLHLRLSAGQLQQPAARALPQAAAPRARDPQAHRRHESQGTHHRAARAVLQGRARQGGDRARQGEAAARQAGRAEAARGGAGARAGRQGETDVSVLLWLVLVTAPPAPAPQTVLIATPRGETSVPVSTERGSAAVAAPRLGPPLGLTVALDGSRSEERRVGEGCGGAGWRCG